jgi:MarR family transcriptional regulator for hemolysin
MVAMIDRLVNAGFVLRAPSMTDRRIKRIVLTDAGKQLYDKVKTEANAFRQQLLAGVPQDRLAVATELLEQIQDLLERST